MPNKQVITLLLSLLTTFSISLNAKTLSEDGHDELDRYLQNVIETTHVPGMVALIVNKEGVVYERAFGLMDSANQQAMTTDAIFNLASMTKAITSTAVMMLVEEGKVDLDAPVENYLPYLKNREVFTSFNLEDGNYTAEPATTKITTRHLLTHTSGLGYSFASPILARAMGSDFAASATTLPLLFEPGTQWAYGESTRVLGHLVETLSGQDLYSFLKDKIFTPLGMNDIHYAIPASKNSRVVTTHNSDGATLIETPRPAGIISSPANGDGGLSSTASDYGRFIRMFLNNGSLDNSGQLISPATVSSMGQPGAVKVALMETTNDALSLPFPLGADVDTYGLGFQITGQQLPDSRSPGSMAWAGIFNTEFWIDPKNEIGVVLLMQFLPFYDETAIEVLQGFEQRIYQNLEAL
jgi:methyl acetate hydrolase